MTKPIIGSGSQPSAELIGSQAYHPLVIPDASAFRSAWIDSMHWAQHGNVMVFDNAYSIRPNTFCGGGELAPHGSNQPSIWTESTTWIDVGKGHRHIPKGFNRAYATLQCKVPKARPKTLLYARLVISHSNGTDTGPVQVMDVPTLDETTKRSAEKVYRDAQVPGIHDQLYTNPFRGTATLNVHVDVQNAPTGSTWGTEAPHFLVQAYASTKNNDGSSEIAERLVPISSRAWLAVEYFSGSVGDIVSGSS